MLKVNRAGIPVEVWPPIELTDEDRAVIAADIITHVNLPRLRKVDGVQKQYSSLNAMEYGYRIYDADTEEKELSEMNAELKELSEKKFH
jgi:hypothetical protein